MSETANNLDLILNIKKNIQDYFSLSDKEEEFVQQALHTGINLARCDGIISTLIELKLDKSSILAFLCYQVYKVQPEEGDRLKLLLDDEQKNMVETFKVIKDISAITKSEQNKDIQNMFIALSKDVRVVIVKIAGALYDVTVLKQPLTTQNRLFLSQVKEIYVPLSERLGLDFLKLNLDDNVVRLEHPAEYAALKATLDATKEANMAQLELAKNKILDALNELGIKAEIQTRHKHISSIYKKLDNKSKNFDQIYDIIAMRVIVQTVEQCYVVLGRVHSLYLPMPGRFKDYIANPKPSGYKSLHTTVIVENNHPMEIQIRTEKMHRENEFGAAAHWLYKEKNFKKTEFDKRVTWFREMVNQAKDLPLDEFVETLKADLYNGVIFVQTPKGRVIEFPDGATAIDFAYAIHSQIGNSCVGVKINGKIMPITTKLKNGDIIEVITSSHSKGPSRDWLKFAKTNSAKSKIRAFFKSEQKEDTIKLGKNSLEEQIKARNFTVEQVLTQENIDKVLEKFNLKSMEELYLTIGSGALTAAQVLGRFVSVMPREEPENKLSVLNIKSNKDGVLIDGDSGMLVRFAGCCNPVNGDEIIGYISRGKGVTVHRKNCLNVKNLEQERIINAQWSAKEDSSFVTSIKIVAQKRDGNLAKFTSVITNTRVTITGFEAKEVGDNFYGVIVVKVKNKAELDKVINLISAINGVKSVYRSEGWK